MDFLEPFKILYKLLLTDEKLKTEEWLSLLLALVILLGLIITIIIKKKKERQAEKDLNTYFEDDVSRSYSEYFVQTYALTTPPSKFQEPREFQNNSERYNLVSYFLTKVFNKRKVTSRFYIILADTGMGKTTFMVNIYMHYIKKWLFKPYKIVLMPFDSNYNTIEEINKIQDQINTILLLDGLDEDYEAVNDINKRLSNIVNASKKFKKVIITCRTQFFASEELEPDETEIRKNDGNNSKYAFHKVYLSPFSDRDVRSFLNKKFPIYKLGDVSKNKRAWEIVKKSPHLMVRPMLLHYIDDLLLSKKSFHRTAEIYEELIDKWISREANRVSKDKRNAFILDLYTFSEELAMLIYKNRSHNESLSVDVNDIKPIKANMNLSIEEWQLTAQSLLSRNAAFKYKFAHKSILEYFIAKEAVKTRNFDFDFTGFDFASELFQEIYLTNLSKSSGRFILLETKFNSYNNQIRLDLSRDINLLKKIKKSKEQLYEDTNVDGLLLPRFSKKILIKSVTENEVLAYINVISKFLTINTMFDIHYKSFFRVDALNYKNRTWLTSFDIIHHLKDISFSSIKNAGLYLDGLNSMNSMNEYIANKIIQFLLIDSGKDSFDCETNIFKFPYLKMLVIQCTTLYSEHYMHEYFPNLQVLFIDCNSGNLDSLIMSLTHCKNLLFLFIYMDTITDAQLDNANLLLPKCIIFRLLYSS